MLDLSRYTFSGKGQQPYSADSLPFAVRVSMPPLRCLLDPEAHLAPVDRAYVDLLGSSSTDHTGVDIATIQINDHRAAEDGRWHVAEQSGETYLFRRMTPAGTNGAIVRKVSGTAWERFAAQRGIPVTEARARYLAYRLATAPNDIHMFVTDVEPPCGYGTRDEVLLCAPDTAMALLGLYQRLRGGMLTVQRGLPVTAPADWVAHMVCRALVPEWQDVQARLRDACADEVIGRLLGSAKLRLERVLVARDELLARVLMGDRCLPFAHTQELVERVAIGLLAMFDAVARAMNIQSSLGVRPQYCAFGKEDFIRTLPDPARRAATSVKLRAVVSVVAILRNTIHHEHLGTGTLHQAGSDTVEHLAYVPDEVVPGFLAACDQLGIRGRLVFEVPGHEDSVGTAVRAAVVADEVPKLALRALREVLRAVSWPPAPLTEQEPPYWEHPDLLATLLRVYGFPADW